MNSVTIGPCSSGQCCRFVLSVVGDIRFVRLWSTQHGGLFGLATAPFQPGLSDFLIEVFPLFERRGLWLDRYVKTERKLSWFRRIIRGMFEQVHIDR